ncbi:hypothetical protein FKG94_18670 [Exilibacterium tricleocarpae]|uniref:Uncharacterized protein n=1 Tax=Exilibacterium tricleocarpae TaxID=2591008 RepID=A0A545T6B7_9GAMM|nr:hypothetical protein [Exilibacterium tricleocarpae]TQV72712.1 hypothetical protein FKG94_18670 [Exilibacterium tricleocarpae]
MSVTDQVNSRQKLADLHASPLRVLTEVTTAVDDPGGHRSRIEQACFGYHACNGIRIGSEAFCRNTNGTMNFDPIRVKVIATPSRARGTPTPQQALQRFDTSGGTDFWITTQESGCTVLIVDWGNNQYSMAHLQPYGASEYNYFSRHLLPHNTDIGVSRAASYLRDEAAATIHNSRIGGIEPLRYILAQSNHWNLAGGGRIQIIGVPQGSAWVFYIQQRDAAGTISVIQPQWEHWRWYQP